MLVILTMSGSLGVGVGVGSAFGVGVGLGGGGASISLPIPRLPWLKLRSVPLPGFSTGAPITIRRSLSCGGLGGTFVASIILSGGVLGSINPGSGCTFVTGANSGGGAAMGTGGNSIEIVFASANPGLNQRIVLTANTESDEP